MNTKAEKMRPCKVVDTSAPLLLTNIQSIKERAYAGIVRYTPHVGAYGPSDITARELELILSEGLGLLLVQHCRIKWDASKLSGASDAASAASRAIAVGYAHGSHIYLDLEDVVSNRADTIRYVNDWCGAMVHIGFHAGIYVGYGQPLTAIDLWEIHDANSYWSDAGPRNVAVRGFAMKQQAQVNIGGILYDPDVVGYDLKHETPVWTVKS